MLLPSINIPKLKIGQTSPRALALLGLREREVAGCCQSLSLFCSIMCGSRDSEKGAIYAECVLRYCAWTHEIFFLLIRIIRHEYLKVAFAPRT